MEERRRVKGGRREEGRANNGGGANEGGQGKVGQRMEKETKGGREKNYICNYIPILFSYRDEIAPLYKLTEIATL